MRRITKGILATALGMNVVALGMKANGSNYAGNPAWDIVSSYLTFQLWIIALAIIFATGLVIIKYAFAETEEDTNLEELQIKQPIYHLETLKPENKDIQLPKEIPKPAISKTPEPPKQLGKEELKKRVLQELTGRSDI